MMRKIMSWVVLGVGIALIIGSVLVGRAKVSTAAFAPGSYGILHIVRQISAQDQVFLLNGKTGTTWLLTEDEEKGKVYWLRLKAIK